MTAAVPVSRNSDPTAASGPMSAPVTGRIGLRGPGGRTGTGGVQVGTGSACGTMPVAGVAVGRPVQVAEGVGVGVGVCVGVRVGVGVVFVGVGVGVAVFMHVQVGVGTGVGVFMHWHVGVGTGLVMQLPQPGIGAAVLVQLLQLGLGVPGCIVAVAVLAGIELAGIMVAGIVALRTVVPEPLALAASAMPPPHNPRTAAASATTTEAAIDLTRSPCLSVTTADYLRKLGNYRESH